MVELDVQGRIEPVAGDELAGQENAKRRQILDGARKVFLADGFDAASMNEIARAAGVSKGTLYVYFDSKDVLFEALIREEKRQQAEQICDLVTDDQDIASVLNRFGVRLLELMLRPDSIAHLRTVLAVASKFPAIGRAFYESGPAYGRRRMAAYFDRQVAAGVIEAEDTDVAASHFLELCKSGYVLQMCLGVRERPTADELAAHVARATETFLRAYRRRG